MALAMLWILGGLIFVGLLLGHNFPWLIHSKLPVGDFGWPIMGETLSFLQPHSSDALGNFLKDRCSRYMHLLSPTHFYLSLQLFLLTLQVREDIQVPSLLLSDHCLLRPRTQPPDTPERGQAISGQLPQTSPRSSRQELPACRGGRDSQTLKVGSRGTCLGY